MAMKTNESGSRAIGNVGDMMVSNDGAREESLRMVSSQPLDNEPVSDLSLIHI